MAATDARTLSRGAVTVLVLLAAGLEAATLPEDRSEAMYHRYEGGGLTVDGPAISVRKNFWERIGLRGGYYVDSITSATIDVVTTASPYDEDRREYNVGVDYLAGDTIMSVDYSNSDENDYTADTYSLGVSHETFGGMTTLSMAYAHGDDVVERVDNDFQDRIDRDNYRLGWSQVLTPTMIASLDYESVVEEGFLNNPYRSARVLGAAVPERYPRTRTSHAVAVTAKKSWNRRIAADVGYRYFTDTWDVAAHTFEIGGTWRPAQRWLVDAGYRYYNQDQASFYSDNFDREFNYMARDKELSTFDSHTIGGRVSWEWFGGRDRGLKRANVTFSYDYIYFDYDNFTDIRDGSDYSMSADVIQLHFSVWY